jgi:hypothetical protein
MSVTKLTPTRRSNIDISNGGGAQHTEINFQGWAPIDFINSHRGAGDFRRKHLNRG